MDLWDRVQARLAENRVTRSDQPTGAVASPLAGRLFDPDGDPMCPSHAHNGKRRYRYYVSRALIERSVEAGAKGWRIPAEEIEGAVAQAIVAKIGGPAFVGEVLAASSDDPVLSAQRIAALGAIREGLAATGSPEAGATLRRLVERIDVGADRLRASIVPGGHEAADTWPGIGPITVENPLRLIRRGGELRLLLNSALAGTGQPDAALIGVLIGSRLWLVEWRGAGPAISLAEIDGVDPGDVSRLTQLAFLAPDLIERVLDGSRPAGLTATRVRRIGDLPMLWG